MIPLGWEEIEALELGRLEGGGSTVRRVLADSREAGPGDLFVALNSGVRYTDDARERGAATLVPDDQGAALAALATVVRSKSGARVVAIVTSDNPRSEEPLAIIQDVLQGSGVDVEIDPDRRSAIERAIGLAEPGDVVLIAGKGHEQGQDVGGVVHPFDDRAVAREALAALRASR